MRIGVDECGWGAIAGPLVSAACWYDPTLETTLRELGFTDSKDLSPAKRAELVACLDGLDGVACQISVVDAEQYDLLGGSKAWHTGMRTGIKLLLHQLENPNPPELTVIVDGSWRIAQLPDHWEQRPTPKADLTDLGVSIASVVGKHWRDTLMASYDIPFPFYGFAQHKGYATAEHLMALMEVGPLLDPYLHRRRMLKPKMFDKAIAKGLWKRAYPAWLQDQANWLNLIRKNHQEAAS